MKLKKEFINAGQLFIRSKAKKIADKIKKNEYT